MKVNPPIKIKIFLLPKSKQILAPIKEAIIPKIIIIPMIKDIKSNEIESGEFKLDQAINPKIHAL